MSECVKPVRIDYVWTEGDETPEIEFTLPGGLLVADFTITLDLTQPDGTVVSIAAVDLGGSQGKFVWTSTSLLQGFNQRAVIRRIRIADSKPQTSKTLLIDVRGRPGG